MAHRLAAYSDSQMFMGSLSQVFDDLNSDDIACYLAAKQQLLKHGQSVISALINVMLTKTEHPHWREGWRAAIVLASMSDTNTIPAFIRALKSPNPLVRQTAARALSEQDTKTAIAPLLDALCDESDGMVQVWIIEAVGNLRCSAAIERLVTVLVQTDSPIVQQSIIRALGRIGDARIAPILVRFFNSTDYHVSSSARQVYEQFTGISVED